MAGLFSGNNMLLIESDRMLKMIVDDFDKVCEKRKLKVTVGKSKIIVYI